MFFDRLVRHRVMRVEHVADHFVGAHLAAQAFVVDDVRLHHAHAQRFVGACRRRRQHRQAHAAVADHQDDHARGHRQRLHHCTHAVAAAHDGGGHGFVGEDQQKGDAGRPADIGDLAQQVRGIQPMAERVAQQFREQPFGRDPRRRTGQRAHHRTVATPNEMTHQREDDELRLQQRRGREHDQQPDCGVRVGVVGDSEAEPRQHRDDEAEAHRQTAARGAADAAGGVQREQPRHQRDEAQQIHQWNAGERSAGGVQAQQGRTGSDRRESAPDGVGAQDRVQI